MFSLYFNANFLGVSQPDRTLERIRVNVLYKFVIHLGLRILMNHQGSIMKVCMYVM
jgi:hypothetical protein